MAKTSPASRSAVALEFAINTAASLNTSGLILDVFGRTVGASGKSGNPGKPKRARIEHQELEQLLLPRSPNGSPATESGGLLALVTELPSSAPRRKAAGQRRVKAPTGIRSLRLPHQLYDSVLPHLCAQRSLSWWDGRTQNSLQPLRWNAGGAWHLSLHLRVDSAGDARLSGALERGSESVPLADPQLILSPSDPASNDATPALVVFDRDHRSPGARPTQRSTLDHLAARRRRAGHPRKRGRAGARRASRAAGATAARIPGGARTPRGVRCLHSRDSPSSPHPLPSIRPLLPSCPSTTAL